MKQVVFTIITILGIGIFPKVMCAQEVCTDTVYIHAPYGEWETHITSREDPPIDSYLGSRSFGHTFYFRPDYYTAFIFDVTKKKQVPIQKYDSLSVISLLDFSESIKWGDPQEDHKISKHFPNIVFVQLDKKKNRTYEYHVKKWRVRTLPEYTDTVYIHYGVIEKHGGQWDKDGGKGDIFQYIQYPKSIPGKLGGDGTYIFDDDHFFYGDHFFRYQEPPRLISKAEYLRLKKSKIDDLMKAFTHDDSVAPTRYYPHVYIVKKHKGGYYLYKIKEWKFFLHIGK